MTMRTVQLRLLEFGYDPGKIDGEDGPRTQAAVKAFQTAHGLVPDGIVGPLTRQALWPERVKELAPLVTVTKPPQHLLNAIAEIGVREKAGRDSSERVIAYRLLGHTTTDTRTDDSARPWCGDFMCAMLETAGIESPRSGMARAIEHHNGFVKLTGPALGAIVTMWRGSPSSGLGHVYFYAGRSARGFNVAVGGNQIDAVTAAEYSVSRVVGYWWPKVLPLPPIGHVPAIIAPGAHAGSEV